jgi:hypothetical protein
MAVKFDFLSPGVNIREIDQSILPAQAQEPGPVLIGRAYKGPAMQPILINTYEDFVDVFGAPILGSAGINNDAWRNGNLAGPQYAGIAAQAHLASQTSPVTFVRLLGDDNPDVPITTGFQPGWSLSGSGASATIADNSTAYGLFLIDSGSTSANKTGVLGAVFYVDSGYMALTGTLAGDGGTVTASAGAFIASQGADKEFKMAIYNASGTKLEDVSFNFNESDNSKYIRSQFNTNPILTNSELVDSDNTKTYWLGETFDHFIADNLTLSAAGKTYGVLLPLETSAGKNWADHNEAHQPAQSGWVIAQDQGAAAEYHPASSNTKLFRFVSLHGGESLQSNVMIGISNITLPIDVGVNAFSTFNIEIMDINGNILEEHRGVNLNPQSSEYIVKRIGDTKYTWSETERRYQTDGTEPNISNYFRVEVSNTVENGAAQGLAPFGFLGPVRPKGFAVIGGHANALPFGATTTGSNFSGVFALGQDNFPASAGGAAFVGTPAALGSVEYTGSFKFPKIALRDLGSQGNPVDQFEVYYGIRPKISGSTRTDSGYVDYVRRLPVDIDGYEPGTDYEYSFVFSLDDLVVNSNTRTVTYTSGSRAAGTSRTATSGAANLLDLDIQQFAMPVWGGFDGLDITEKEPFRNTILNDSTYTAQTNNALLYSAFKAIDSVRDNEQVIANTISMPGVWADKVTDKMISTAETRKDLLAVIDVEGGYTPNTEQTTRAIGSVSSVISEVKSRKFNSSYACVFYPWVQIQANTGVDSGKLWAPPSVAAIGAFAKSTAQSELWFAPAGFSRGGLSPLGGSGGPSVVNVDGTLSAKDRDKLYQLNVNPIASFPGEGIVVFGQKTLQATPSALDRINVRRLLIYLKHELSRISRSLLFEPNVNATWVRFKSQADSLLSQVKANFGVTEYKIVLDETTTTADLIDRNILYAKVYIKPTRAIEYIVVDLVVTNTGAEFV